MICPEIRISPAESDEKLNSSANFHMIVDEGIDVDLDFARVCSLNSLNLLILKIFLFSLNLKGIERIAKI